MQSSIEATTEEESNSLPWQQEINEEVTIKTEQPDVNDDDMEYLEPGNNFSRHRPLGPITLHVKEEEAARNLSDSPVPVQLVDTAMTAVEAPIESQPAIPRWEDLLRFYNETVQWMQLPKSMN